MAKDDKTTKVKDIKGKGDKGQSDKEQPRVDSRLFEPFQLRGLTMRTRPQHLFGRILADKRAKKVFLIAL